MYIILYVKTAVAGNPDIPVFFVGLDWLDNDDERGRSSKGGK